MFRRGGTVGTYGGSTYLFSNLSHGTPLSHGWDLTSKGPLYPNLFYGLRCIS